MSEPVEALWDPEQFRQLMQRYGSYTAIAAAIGTPREKVRYWGHRHGIPGAPISSVERQRAREVPPPGAPPVQASQPPGDGLEEAALAALRKGPTTVEALANALDRGPATVRELLARLAQCGYRVAERAGQVMLERDVTPAEAEAELPKPATDGHLRIGVVSDTHLGSRMQQLTFLRDTYKRFEDAKAQLVLHCGDLLDGVDVYRGQHAQQFLHTYDEQVDYAVEHYPRSSLKTLLIGGNHDLAGIKRGDADPLRLIAMRRPDIEYLGPYSAWPRVGRLLMHLLHPDGPQAYALGYKLMKLAESYEGGKKPNVAIAGHWHQMCYFQWRGIHLLHPGCFQSQTEFERRKALQPQVGGLLLDIVVSDDGAMHAFTPTFYRYYVPRENDY